VGEIRAEYESGEAPEVVAYVREKIAKEGSKF